MISHTTELTVAWGDCDPAGIVFYPRYFAWFDRASHGLFSAHGLDHRAITERYDAVGFSLVDAQAGFRSPGTYGDALHIDSRIARVGRSSITVEHTIRCGERVLVEGKEVRVWVAREGDRLKSVAFPAEVAAALAGAASRPVSAPR